MRLAVKLSKRKPSKSLRSNYENEDEMGKITRKQDDRGNKVARKLKGSPFPDVYTLVHTTPIFRTTRGNIVPGIKTYAIEGQGNRRIRFPKPKLRADPVLFKELISIKKAKRLLKGGLESYDKARRKTGVQSKLRDLEKGLEGPNAAFFKE